MKIRFESDDDLALGKTFNIVGMIIVTASVLEKNGKYYPQCFSMNARISYKNVTVQNNWYSEGIDTNNTSASKECMFCHYWYFKDVEFKNLNHMFVINVMMYW